MNNQSIVKDRGITRLCHFTKSANLPFILGDGVEDFNGIVSNSKVQNAKFLQVNDVNRYDKRPELICASIQYPNFFFFERSQDNHKNDLLSDWVVILISPDIIDDETYFCPVNAARSGGGFISRGVEAFRNIFADSIHKYEERYPNRPEKYPSNVPSSIQAEVLFEKDISRDSIFGLVFSNLKQAKVEKMRLQLCNVELNNIDFFYSEDFFRKESATLLRAGRQIAIYKLEE